MSRESSSTSHTSAISWTLSLLLALPMLYLLSVPPIACLAQRFGMGGIYESRALSLYVHPASWVYSHVPPAQAPMSIYAEWWREKFGQPGDPFRPSYL